jgi:prepilin-type N-terminal cleavage/methylation domain-containing protein
MLYRAKSAFTLVELLVVIAIIALLLSIIVPSTTKAREQGRRTVCLTNLHAIGQAIFVYAEGHDDKLIPGDYDVPWAVWAPVEYRDGSFQNKPVNLGHLIVADSLPLPKDDKDTMFCPSMRKNDCIAPDGNVSFNYKTFDQRWGLKGSGTIPADINYMLNTQLDGFGIKQHFFCKFFFLLN